MVGDISWMMNWIFKKRKMVGNQGWMFGDFQAFLILKDLVISIIHLKHPSIFKDLWKNGGTPWGFHIHWMHWRGINALSSSLMDTVGTWIGDFQTSIDAFLLATWAGTRFSMDLTRSKTPPKTGEKWDDFFKRVQQQAGISKYIYIYIFFFEILHFWVVPQFWPY